MCWENWPYDRIKARCFECKRILTCPKHTTHSRPKSQIYILLFSGAKTAPRTLRDVFRVRVLMQILICVLWDSNRMRLNFKAIAVKHFHVLDFSFPSGKRKSFLLYVFLRNFTVKWSVFLCFTCQEKVSIFKIIWNVFPFLFRFRRCNFVRKKQPILP